MSLLQWLLFAGIFFSPFLDGGISILGTRIVLLQIYFVGMVILALLALPRRSDAVSHPDRVRFWLILWVASWLISTVASTHQDVAVLELIRNLELLVFGLVVAKSVRTSRDLRFLLVAFIGAAVWVSLVGWIQSVWGNDALMLRRSLQVNSQAGTFEGVYVGDRVVTAFGDPITSGQFLCTALGAALAWALATPNRRMRWMLIGVTASIALPLLTSGSRGPILAGAITSLALIISRIRSSRSKAAFLAVLAMLFIGGTTLVVPDISIPSQLDSSGSVFAVPLLRFSQSFAGRSSTRLDYWIYVVDMAVHNPLGVGFGNFLFIAPYYIPAYLVEISYGMYVMTNAHAESLYFNQLVEAGFLGLLSFLGLVISVFIQTLSSSRSRFWDESDVGTNLAFVVLGAWLASSLSFITSYAYSNNGVAVTFWFLVGLSMALPRLVNAGFSSNAEL